MNGIMAQDNKYSYLGNFLLYFLTVIYQKFQPLNNSSKSIFKSGNKAQSSTSSPT